MKKILFSVLLSLSVAAAPPDDCHDPSLCEGEPAEPVAQPSEEADDMITDAYDCLMGVCIAPVLACYAVPCIVFFLVYRR